ncbi:MAG: threonine synthase [Gammaproteobacteria bacterium]|nr:threonine synthase [Gammaproteobacteria bacterium]NNC68772.1 threonine synthase [Gammaproteobacteria bacterium]
MKKAHYTGLIDRYRDVLPLAADCRVISLCEGDTPLIECHNIKQANERDIKLFLKFEGLNPTGSFKDRGMTVAVTQAVTEGSQAIICASTGNTSASAAAYAARAGIKAFVLIPDGKIAMGKLAQAMMHGASIIQIRGNFDDGMRLVKEVANEAPVNIVNSINPYRLQGQKTAAYEIAEALGQSPDFHCIPVGNAGNISAHWTGYAELAASSGKHVTKACGFCNGDCQFTGKSSISNRPKMLGYQAAGAAPFIKGSMIDNPDTVATAIRIGHPQSWDLAQAAVKESGGWFNSFTDEEILATQKLLATKEGVFCEPASATSVTGALHDMEVGNIQNGSTVVCTVTGHGLKDPDIAIKQSATEMLTIDAELDSVKRAILNNI